MADFEWFTEFANSSPVGESLPYDPRLGLTEDEYAEFLAGPTEPGIVAQAVIGLGSLADDRYELSGATATGDLTGIVFDARTMTFATPFGVTGAAVPWINSNTSSFLGAANGWRWEYVDPQVEADASTASGSAIKITLALREADGRVYLSVEGGEFEEGLPVSSTDVDLLYDSNAS